MRITGFMVLLVIVLVMLGVMGHSIWHGPMLVVCNAVTEIFSGGHVVKLWLGRRAATTRKRAKVIQKEASTG